MKIEKMCEVSNNHVTNKINELIDFINTHDQDRSEQMARVIDKFKKLEEIFNSKSDFHSANWCALIDRICALENATQSKKEERILSCPWCGSIPEQSVLVCLPPIYQIKCGSYGCQNKSGFHGSTPQEAVKAWNKRV